MATGPLSVVLLGGFAVRRDDHEVPDGGWRLRKAQSVVKLLALAPNHTLHREQVMEVLWPRLEPGAGRNNLNQAVHSARRALGVCQAAEELVSNGSMLSLGGPLRIDVEDFEIAADQALRSGKAGEFRRALALYAGELLPEDRFEPWTESRRAELLERALALLDGLATIHRRGGDNVGEVEVLRKAVIWDPLHEPACRRLMAALARGGRRHQALAQFHELRRLLSEVVGADPEPETRALYARILGAPDAPADRGARGRTNVRPPLTSFIGRNRELAELDAAFGRERLVTLSGPGGAGKSRLAAEAAVRALPRFPGGAWEVKLAGLRDGDLLPDLIARTLDVPVPPRLATLTALTRDLAAREPLLIVLDNCEHLVEACAGVALDLLQACPPVTLVVTSREPLRIPGEVVRRVPALALPERGPTADPAGLADCEAVRLFVDRASARVAGFTIDASNSSDVLAICHALDGIPLAIELAAGALGALSLGQIAQRLADSPDPPVPPPRGRAARHHTMRTVLEWSHELLGPAERAVYRRLGVFEGGFSLDAAEAVCAGPHDVLGAVIGLVDKSLVQAEDCAVGRRYRLLELTRMHALEKLALAGELEDTRARHRDVYRALVARADPRSAAGRPDVLDALETELANVHAALSSGLAEDPAAALELAGQVWPFWLERGYFAEGARWLDAALDVSEPGDTARAETLAGTCAIDTRLGRFDRRPDLVAERIAVLRRLGDARRLAEAINDAGLTAWSQSDHAVALAAFAEADTLVRDIGDGPMLACVAHSRALLAGCRGELGTAAELLTEVARFLGGDVDPDGSPFFPAARYCLIVATEPWCPGPRLFFEDSMMFFRRLSQRSALAYALANHAHTERARGRLEEAAVLADRALSVVARPSERAERAVMLIERGNLARALGEHGVGRGLLTEACAVRRALGDRRGLAMALGDLGLLDAAAGHLDRARRLLDESLLLFTELDDRVGVAGAQLNAATVALVQGDRLRERHLLRQSLETTAERGLSRMSSWTRVALAHAELALGDPDRARRLLDEARAEFDLLGDRRGLAGGPALQSRR